MQPNENPYPEGLILNEVQLILAEKRTSLAILRTGIAILVLPLSVLSVLIATSKYYEFGSVMHLLVPLFVLSVVMVLLSGYLVIRSMRQIHHYDLLIRTIKQKNSSLSELIE